MLVTINTDASYLPLEKVGGWAFWIRSDDFVFKKFGYFKEPLNDPLEAELFAVINALAYLSNQGIRCTKIIVNTDCYPAIDFLNKKTVSRLRKIKIGSVPLLVYYNNLITKLLGHNSKNIEYRHVKAHTAITNARSFINDWCDARAKEQAKLKKILKNDCQK